MKDRAEFGVVAITRNAVMLLALALSFFYLVDDFQVLGNNKWPVAEAFAENLFCFPSEEFLRGGRPA